MSGTVPVVIGSNGIMTAAQFRQLQPAFSDSSVYTDEMLSLYLQMASSQLDPNRWADWLPLGTALYTAHFLALDAREAKAARNGVPGQGSIGVMTSKSLGGLSASYDVSAGSEGTSAGHWNSTSFGRRYIHMAKLVGMGGVQITGALLSGAPASSDYNGPKF